MSPREGSLIDSSGAGSLADAALAARIGAWDTSAPRSEERRSLDMDNLLPLGGTFAGLHVESLVGRGGMGVVYRARQVAPYRTVALKVLAPELDGDHTARARFLAEIELLAAVEHPHIVPMYDAGETDGRLWLTMRLLEGPSIRSLVERRGPLVPGVALELLAPIAAALDAIHAAGLVHGDVGPANVLLDSHGEPYLADFGIARRLGAPAERLGTLAYLAPERIAASSEDTDGSGAVPAAGGAAADRYAFAGLVLYALTGRPPFEGPTADDVLRAHLDAPPPSASARRRHLPPALDPVIARGLAKDPAARQAMAVELLDDVRRALRAAPPTPAPADPRAVTLPVRPEEPGGVGARTRSRVRRRSIPASIAGVALGLVAVLLVTGSMFGFGLVPVAGILGLPAAARSPNPSATGKAVPTPTPRPTPKPTAAPRLGAAADVARLRVLLPSVVRNDCRSAALEGGALVAGGDLAMPDAIAAVSCPLADTPGTNVRYVLFPTAASLAADWQATVGAAGIATSGRCEQGSPFIGSWRQPAGILGLGQPRTGQIACWLGRDGSARIDWTLDGVPVVVSLRRTDEDLAAAYARWSSDDLSPQPANR
jgi:tRNA A-37 threonylcarbamoyl transferase component Bud32